MIRMTLTFLVLSSFPFIAYSQASVLKTSVLKTSVAQSLVEGDEGLQTYHLTQQATSPPASSQIEYQNPNEQNRVGLDEQPDQRQPDQQQPAQEQPRGVFEESQESAVAQDTSRGQDSGNDWINTSLKQAAQYDDNTYGYVQNTGRELQNHMEIAKEKGDPYLVWVNIPSYTLRLYDVNTGEMMLKSRVIVGLSKRQTPIFDTNIINLKFNPDWTPPASIKNAEYAAPGINNPLGLVRFSTDNSSNIYLHDTNNHSLFNRSTRALSHGCVRVQEWHQMAQILLGGSQHTVDTYLSDGKTKYIKIPSSLVWISYERIDLDETNTLSIFPDIYHKQDLVGEFHLGAPASIESRKNNLNKIER